MRLVFLFFAILFGINASAQEYKEMFKDGRVWNYAIEEYGDGEIVGSWKVKVNGDTIVDGHKAKKILVQKIYKYLEGNYYELHTFGYEEDRRVFFADTKKPVIDFNMHEGDVVDGIKLMREDSIEVRGIKYRRLYFNFSNYPNTVEGIGERDSVFGDIFGGPVHDRSEIITFVSCYENGELIFTESDFDSPATTGVEAVLDTKKKDGKVYDVQGHRVEQTQPNRIYICDGVKFIGR